MRLTRHACPTGPRWALDGAFLSPAFSLSLLAQATDAQGLLRACRTEESARGDLLAPIDPHQELWAAGVTYLRSMEARAEESDIGARLYAHVYESERPELFFKSPGWRVVAEGRPIRIRRDSDWNVPEPEMTLLVNTRLEIIGYTAGNDVSSRSIEGANALFLPQAKIYDAAAALGPGIVLTDRAGVRDLPITLEIRRAGKTVFEGMTSSARMKRDPAELCRWLGAELSFPDGALLMTGTGLVPGEAFTLQVGDEVAVGVGSERLVNVVA
ncbi:MAG: fumarylacetoacetate hydrolase [Leptolyngbya sp. PLA3]|nr:MAG: fumarylacetoacetate hydrolase [Cyanobacteria bacterium CYA]MCE7968283.1 fumarylacetoacetate hydrolase [Leptolyngbya sp. PL-A3]